MDNSPKLISLLYSSRQIGIIVQTWRRASIWFNLHPNKTVALIALMARSAISAIAIALALGLVPWQLLGRLRTLKQFPIKSLQPIVTFTTTFAPLLTPWMIRNYLAFDRLIIGSTLVGYNLFRHNHIVATDDYLGYVDGVEARQALAALLARRTDLKGNEDEAQMDAIYQAEANRIISAIGFPRPRSPIHSSDMGQISL